MTGTGGPTRIRAAAKIREIEIFGYKVDENIEDDPIEKIDTDQLDALLLY